MPWRGPLFIDPISSKELTIVGKDFYGIFDNYKSLWSHLPSLILHKYVLDALDKSVTNLPVKLQVTQASIVPNKTQPDFSLDWISGLFSRIQKILKREKYVETGNPVICLKSPHLLAKLEHISAVRLSDQTIAL